MTALEVIERIQTEIDVMVAIQGKCIDSELLVEVLDEIYEEIEGGI